MTGLTRRRTVKRLIKVLKNVSQETVEAAVDRSAAQLLVDQLLVQGVREVFCVPGESFLDVLDALFECAIDVIVSRHECGAAIMAEVVGRATNRPGICFVTRGPGATNAAHAVHIAQQSSAPLILFVGQIARRSRGREAFQEIDYKALFGPITKWSDEIDDAARIPEMISRAFHTAMNGRPGPVALALPEDMLAERVRSKNCASVVATEIALTTKTVAGLEAFLTEATAPLLVLGGPRWSADDCNAILQFAERWSLPVVTSFRRNALFDATHPNYWGDLGIGANPKLLARVKAADLIIGFGGRFGDIPSQGYTLLDIPRPACRFVHFHSEPSEIGRVYHADLGGVATPAGLAQAVDGLRPARDLPWRQHVSAGHEDFLRWSSEVFPQPGSVNLGSIVVWLSENLAPNAIVCNGAGNFAAWVGRYLRVRRYASHFGPMSGSMGYGVPAAIALQHLYSGSLVVCFTGDGDFLMTGQEFATAIQYELPIVVIVCDNGMYGTIRMHQERRYPGRVCATSLTNPDFAAYARAFGGAGITVTETEAFAGAFESAVRSRKPSLIHLKIHPDAILPDATLNQIRQRALSARARH